MHKGVRLFKIRPLLHLRELGDSQPSSAYSLSRYILRFSGTASQAKYQFVYGYKSVIDLKHQSSFLSRCLAVFLPSNFIHYSSLQARSDTACQCHRGFFSIQFNGIWFVLIFHYLFPSNLQDCLAKHMT